MMKTTKCSRQTSSKADRNRVTLAQMMDMLPDEITATKWFEEQLWNGDRCCCYCRSLRTRETLNRKPMPYSCSDQRKCFYVRSMKLQRDIGVRQQAAWFMLYRIR